MGSNGCGSCGGAGDGGDSLLGTMGSVASSVGSGLGSAAAASAWLFGTASQGLSAIVSSVSESVSGSGSAEPAAFSSGDLHHLKRPTASQGGGCAVEPSSQDLSDLLGRRDDGPTPTPSGFAPAASAAFPSPPATHATPSRPAPVRDDFFSSFGGDALASRPSGNIQVAAGSGGGASGALTSGGPRARRVQKVQSEGWDDDDW